MEKRQNLEIQLSYKCDELQDLEQKLSDSKNRLSYEKEDINVLKERLYIINKDLINNKDALKLKTLGSTQGWEINKDVCSTCHQRIHDSLLPKDINYNLMTIEENINYLQAQKDTLEFSIGGHKLAIDENQRDISTLETQILNGRKIVRSLKNDLYSKEQNVSEAVIREKLVLGNEIE